MTMICDSNSKQPFCSRIIAFLAMASMAGTFLGCGDGIKRVQLSGKVTHQGQPVESGQIRFVPQAGCDAPLTLANIEGGRYNTDKSGGVAAGDYKVMINAFDPDVPPPTGPGSPPRKQLLPAQYNTRSKLIISIKPEEDNRITDFELK